MHVSTSLVAVMISLSLQHTNPLIARKALALLEIECKKTCQGMQPWLVTMACCREGCACSEMPSHMSNLEDAMLGMEACGGLQKSSLSHDMMQASGHMRA